MAGSKPVYRGLCRDQGLFWITLLLHGNVPFDEIISSLSAILLDDVYYAFILDGRRNIEGLPWTGVERLIPLRARAWLDLSMRKAAGQNVDAKDIRKHGNDVFRLSQLLTAD